MINVILLLILFNLHQFEMPKGPKPIYPSHLKHLECPKPNYKKWTTKQINLFNLTQINHELKQFEIVKCVEVGCYGLLLQDKSLSGHVKRKHGIGGELPLASKIQKLCLESNE